jgi:hypothetical protein
MLTIAGGILIAYGTLIAVVVGGGLIVGIALLPFRFVHLLGTSRSKKKLPVRHYHEELPDHFGDS